MRNKKYVLPYNLQFFAEPGEPTIASQADLSSFLDGMTGDSTPAAEAPAEEPPAEETPAEEPDTEPEADPPAAEPKPAVPDKQGYAFAQMRQQNAALAQQSAQLTQLLTKLATANGVQFSDNTDLLNKLNDDALTKIAQKQGIPKEYLQRMEQLEMNDKVHQTEQLKTAAFIGFQNIKTKFGLEDAALQAFAQELDDKGKNPFIQKVDLTELYTAWHFDEILERKTQAAVEAALKNNKAADQHSSTPSSVNGKPGSGEEKISTVAELSKFLDGAK